MNAFLSLMNVKTYTEQKKISDEFILPNCRMILFSLYMIDRLVILTQGAKDITLNLTFDDVHLTYTKLTASHCP